VEIVEDFVNDLGRYLKDVSITLASGGDL